MNLASFFSSYLFDLVFLAQSSGLTPSDFESCGSDCPASAFNAVTAAFATLGYYAQAEWLHLIHNGGLGIWATFAYLIAGITVIVSMAMGLPPKMYLWLAVGPAVFFWLTDYRTPVKGVAWRVGVSAANETMGPRDMREVWKLAEVGLLNDNYIMRQGMRPRSDGPPESGNGLDECSEAACVSSFFAMVDHLISDSIQQLVWIMGVSRARPATPGENSNVFSDLSDMRLDDSLRMWDLTTNLKWEFIQGITSARIANNDLRHMFAQFMSSECGTEFINSIDKKQMTAATYSHGTNILGNVLLLKEGVSDPDFVGPPSPISAPLFSGSFSCSPSNIVGPPAPVGNSYVGPAFQLMTLLEKENVPTPQALRKIAGQSRDGAIGQESGISGYYTHLVSQHTAKPTEVANIREVTNCRTMLTMVMQGLRWEAAQITYQLLRSAPVGMLPGAYAGQMLYGWDIKDPDSGNKIDIADAPKYLENLILIHLFRNELQIAPSQITEQRLSGGQKILKNVQDFQRINGQVSKYGELYTWALMVPYFQGKLLYFLAIAYPFASILVLVPGMHRAIIQWVQFWVWVKIWDLGFAMVTILERSIWAMTSNTLAKGHINEAVFAINKLNPTCIDPGFFDASMTTTYTPRVSMPVLEGDALAGLVDRLLKLSNNIDLDMSNTYYVYIMSALYFAIPAVTGQLVLGARSGAAGMISSAIERIASPAGSAAGQAVTADLGAKMKMNQAVGRQEAFARALRGGLAANALQASNQSTADSMMSNLYGTKGQLLGDKASAVGLASGANSSVASLDRAGMTMAVSAGGAAAGLLTNAFGNGVWARRMNTLLNGSNATGTGGGGTGALSVGAQGAAYAVDHRRHEKEMGYNRERAGILQEQASLKGQSFGHQIDGQIRQLESGRAESHASFAGEQAAWEAANNYAQANSDFTAAVGLGAGYLDPGQKPTNMQGMAREGMLGGAAARESNASNEVQGGDLWFGSGAFKADVGFSVADTQTRSDVSDSGPGGGADITRGTILGDNVEKLFTGDNDEKE